MSTVITKFLCSAMMSLVGLKVVKNISGSKTKLLSVRSMALMSLLMTIPGIMYTTEYSYIYSIVIYAMTIITYREILDISLIKSIIACGIMLLFLLLLDVSLGLAVTIFLPINALRKIWYANIIINLIFSILLLVIFNANKVKENLPIFIDKLSNKNVTKVVIAIIISIITMFIILYTLTTQSSINNIFTSNILLFVVFFLLIIFLLGERNNYEKLSDEYDSLFKYIQVFEDWIEKEQLTRHEYKNQLAVLRNLTSEKRVKAKIDSIVEDFIDIDKKMISQLKNMPNGGLKGLLYYKISISRRNGINIVMDIDEQSGKLLSEISEEKQKTLTKLLGIYLDNAIEGALDTKNKDVSVEVYLIRDKVKIVISNSYNEKIDLTNRNMKGKSTKGKNRGNGLYFASKLMSMNNWIEQKQELKGSYYIQILIITI